MRTARFFVPAEWVAKSAKAFSIPPGSVHKQMTTVLRMKVGDAVSLLTGDGEELDGQITDINRSAIMGGILGSKTLPLPSPAITVCAAMTKRDTFEWTLQKCTELGAVKFIPLLTDRVIKRPKDTPKRWHEIAREAAEQSGRVTLPSIAEPMSLKAALAETTACSKILMHESGGDKLPKLHKSSCVAVFIGPEGGFTDDEVALARTSGATIVTLGNLILRAETAAVAITTLLRYV